MRIIITSVPSASSRRTMGRQPQCPRIRHARPADPAILARRDEIVAGLQDDPRRRARDLRRGRAPRLRDRRAHRLPRRAAGRGAAALDRGGRGGPGLPQREAASRSSPRGAGTSLSGGALPSADAVVVGLARLNRILAIDYENRIARVEAGVTNINITNAVAGTRLLLRARPVEPARLHHRRQHRHELGRRPLPQVRRHHQQRARREAWC